MTKVTSFHAKKYPTTKGLKAKLTMENWYMESSDDGVYCNYLSLTSHEHDPEIIWTYSGGLKMTKDQVLDFIECLESRQSKEIDDYTFELYKKDRDLAEKLYGVPTVDQSMRVWSDDDKTYLYFPEWYGSGGTTIILTDNEVYDLVTTIKVLYIDSLDI
ncbi:hypothetical protein CHH61_03320 [Shouchella clausii]|uniref:Uncharacterized protein n=1 Tax=Shouchella clausii TaxID=79880 RepID=A0A268S4L5_SHOCL|nr:hypothetical protein [Shouchella clausii]PAF27439.1 hypothetical protein CHH61_03320 [Shouchella clausii]